MAKCLFCDTEFEIGRNTFGKYCSRECQPAHKKQVNYTAWKRGAFTPNPHAIRDMLHSYETVQCAICGVLGVWNGAPMRMVCDHIDGNPYNNAYTNFRLICNNCDSQLPTYKGRNRGKGRHTRMERYKRGESY